jgi:hypothetical protein
MASTQQLYGKVTPPIETKIAMDKDYDYYIAKYNTQPPPPPPPPRNSKYHGNLGVVPMEPVMEQMSMGTPPRHPTTVTPTGTPGRSSENGEEKGPKSTSPQDGGVDGDEALLDLAQLEELHFEAERMKALGNKHMAAQVRERKSFRDPIIVQIMSDLFFHFHFPLFRNTLGPTMPILPHCNFLPWVLRRTSFYRIALLLSCL